MSLAGRLHVASRPHGPELSIANRCRQVHPSRPGCSSVSSFQCVRERHVSSSAFNGGATAQPAAPDTPAAAAVRPAPNAASQQQLQDRLQRHQQPQQQESSMLGRPINLQQQEQVQLQQDSPLAAQQQYYPWQITGDINRARSIEQLQDVVQTYGTRFNHIHVSAAFVQLQRLWISTSTSGSSSSAGDTSSSNGSNSSNGWSGQQAEPSARRTLLLQLLQMAQSLQRVDGRYCANVLYSLALVEQQGESAAYCPPLIDQLCAASFELVNGMNPQELATLLWSFAMLDILPAPQLLRRICANILRRCHAFSPQDLAMTLAGLPRVQQQQRVSPYHTVHKLAATAAQKMHVASPLECALLLSRLAAVTYRPDASWLDSYYTASQEKLSSMDCAVLGMTGWALGQMSPLAQTPPADWLCSFENALLEQCIRGRQQHQQEQQHQQQAFSASISQAGSSSDSVNPENSNPGASSRNNSDGSVLQRPAALVELTMGVYGWSKAAPGQPPSQAFQQLLFNSTQQVLYGTSSSSLTLQQQHKQRQRQRSSKQLLDPTSFVSLAVQRTQQTFLQQQDSGSAQPDDSSSSGCISPRIMVELLSAAARWRIVPPRQWLLSVLGRLQPQLTAGSCSSRDTANLLWALATLGVRPSTAWLDDCAVALQRQLEQRQQQQRRQQLVDRPWRRQQGGLPSVADESDSQQMVLSKQLAVALWACHKLQYTVRSVDFWSSMWSVSRSMLTQQSKLADIAMLLEGAVQQQQQPPRKWLQLALTAAVRKAAGAAAELLQQQRTADSTGLPKQHRQQQRRRPRHQHAGVLKSSTATVAVDVLRVATAAARLRTVSGHAWCSEVVEALQPAQHQLNQQCVSRLVWSLGKLGYRPAGSSLAPWLAAAVSRISPDHLSTTSSSSCSMSSSDMCLLLSGLRGCGVVMSGRWMSAFLNHSQQHAADWPLQVVIQVLLYVSSCRVTPQAAWSAAMAQALETAVVVEQQQQHELDARQLRVPALLVAMTKLRMVPSAQLLQQLEQAAPAAAAAAADAPAASITQAKRQPPDVASLTQRLRDLQQTSTAAVGQPPTPTHQEAAQQGQQQHHHQESLQPQLQAAPQQDQLQPLQPSQQHQQQTQQTQQHEQPGMQGSVNGSCVHDHDGPRRLNGNSRPSHGTGTYVARGSSSYPENSSASSEWAGAMWVAGTATSSNNMDASFSKQQLDVR